MEELTGDAIEEDSLEDTEQSYVPQCDPDLKPYIGQIFLSVDDGVQFYKAYGVVCGFDIRLGTHKKYDDGTVTLKYIHCNREGSKNVARVDGVNDVEASTIKRRKISRRFQCKAVMVLKYTAFVGYVVYRFVEHHTHVLVPDAYKHFMKSNRKLENGHQQFILNCARANIGPVNSFRLLKEVVGGYSKVGCNVTEFKNFSRDLHAYAIGKDAQMILDKLHRQRELCAAFTFDYCVDDNEKLTRLFWADPIARRNFHVFGDVVAFDSTYEKNKYNMIFASFTGKDNHGKCVTFAAGLLSSEDVESYSWLFEKFVACMSRAPKMIITDQDPAMKIAINRILTGTTHRLCMWHIMKKVKEKVPTLYKDPSFKKALNSNVWCEMLEPSEFENNWNELLNSFDLSDNSWFKSMYAIRQSWVPAYFRDFPMSGLLKTTSISESENNFFGRYANKNANLVEFFMHFDSAMDTQRHTYERLSSEDHSYLPEMKTGLLIEKHAARVFTTNIFLELQNDILAACYNSNITNIIVREFDILYELDGCTALFDKANNSVTCSCKKFVRKGLICSHMFSIFKNLNIEHIPEQYVVTRWTKAACVTLSQDMASNILNDAARTASNRISTNNVYSEVFKIVGMVDGNAEKTNAFLRCLQSFKDELDNEGEAVSGSRNKGVLFEEFYGSTIPSDVSVLPPDPIKTKGSGSRLVSRREKASRVMNKPLRRCAKCNQMARHDARNCGKQKDN